MKMSKMLFGGLVFAVMATSAVSGFATVELQAAEARVAQARTTANTKGVVKSLDDTSLVLVPSDNKKAEVPFVVSSTTTKEGTPAAGSQVTVTYYFEAGKRVATAIAAKK